MNMKGVVNNEFVAKLAVLGFAFLAGWIACGQFHGYGKAAPETAHAQESLGNGNVLAERVVPAAASTVTSRTVVPPGSAVVATIRSTHAASKPVWQPPADLAGSASPPVAPPDCADYVRHYVQNLVCPAEVVDETLVKNKDGSYDVVEKNSSADGKAGADDKVVFNPGLLGQVPKRHPWGLGVAQPLGVAGRTGVAMSYDFELLPVTTGVSVLTLNGKTAAVATAIWHF